MGLMALLLLVVGPGSAAAVDPRVALVGRWEGRTEIPNKELPSPRVLVIKPVEAAGDAWKVQATDGVTKALTPVEARLSVVGDEITLEFFTAHNLWVKLRLEDDRILAGTHRTHSGRPYPMRLEKVTAGSPRP
jgi:hypothetical protein